MIEAKRAILHSRWKFLIRPRAHCKLLDYKLQISNHRFPMPEPSTPLMRQYAAIKKEHPSALLLFRLGDFYELFFDDAVVAARELQITLTSRNKEKGMSIPMCGVPYHAAEGYISKLIRRGFKVAICEQMEDPRLAKKLVRRGGAGGGRHGGGGDGLPGGGVDDFLAAKADLAGRGGGAGVRGSR